MPCGPKKRRAIKRKNNGNTSSTNLPEEKLVAAVGLFENVSNVSDDVNAEAVDARDSNESQSVDQIACQAPLMTDESENRERSEDVPIEFESLENKEKESQYDCVSDEIIMDGSVMESATTVSKSSETVGNKGSASESVLLDSFLLQAPLIHPSSKEAEENELAEVSEKARHGPTTIVNDVVSVLNEDGEMPLVGALQSALKDNHDSLKEPCFVDLVSPVEGVVESNSYLNEIVGLFTTLLKDLIGMKAWHEQGIVRMTKISLQVRLLSAYLEEIGQKKAMHEDWQRSITEMSSQFSHLFDELRSEKLT